MKNWLFSESLKPYSTWTKSTRNIRTYKGFCDKYLKIFWQYTKCIKLECFWPKQEW